MADFKPAHEFLKLWEGGYAFDPADRGGETIFGIARKHHPHWLGWIEVDSGQYNMDELAKLADTFYESEFWSPLMCDAISDQRMATIIYQAAVNCSISRAVRWLQKSLAVESRGWLAIDGKMGPKTLGKLNKCDTPHVIADDVLDAQEEHYRGLALRDSTQRRFLNGWLNRIKAARLL